MINKVYEKQRNEINNDVLLALPDWRKMERLENTKRWWGCVETRTALLVGVWTGTQQRGRKMRAHTFPSYVSQRNRVVFYSFSSCILKEGYKIVKRWKYTSKTPEIIPVNQSWDSQCASSILLSSEEMIIQPAHPKHPKQSKKKKEHFGIYVISLINVQMCK